MSLREAIQSAVLQADPAPTSEATTLFRVIDPLLLALGYAHSDIEPESTVSPGQRPDRTILPESPHEWYLEAKAWSVPLDGDRQLHQALNYANSRGRRWVVLTNGQTWRLYDNHLSQCMPVDRLTAEARLDDVNAVERLLTALTRDSVMTGRLQEYALHSRLRAVLSRHLADADSNTVRAICSTLRREPGLGTITPRDVLECLRANGDRSGTHSIPASRETTLALPAPSAGAPTPAVGADRGLIREELLRLIRGTPQLVEDHSTNTYVRFCSRAWDTPNLRSGSGWTNSGRILLFECILEPDRVQLLLWIGPGPAELRGRLFDLARRHMPPFSRLPQAAAGMGAKHQSIYRRPLLRPEECRRPPSEQLDLLRDEWGTFVRSDLPRIEAVVQSEQ
jgi:hypothetical protein